MTREEAEIRARLRQWRDEGRMVLTRQHGEDVAVLLALLDEVRAERDEWAAASARFSAAIDALSAELAEALTCGERRTEVADERERCARIADEEAREWKRREERAELVGDRADVERLVLLGDVASAISTRIRTGRCGVRVGTGTPLAARCDLPAHHANTHRNPETPDAEDDA